MRASTLPRFLLGSRQAILDIAATPAALWVGLALVFSASLARNYDGAYLPREPEVLLHGIIVSTFNAVLIFSLVWLLAAGRNFANLPTYWRGFLSFLAIFWMTSPLAWLYGIPYEHLLRVGQAVEANLWTLALVALWRILLITRVLSVLFSIHFAAAFFVVAAIADIEILIASVTMKGPLIDVMGGLQHTEPDRMLSDARFAAFNLAILSAPLWIIGAIAALAMTKAGAWTPGAPQPGSRTLALVAILPFLAFIPLLALMQPGQKRRYEAEQLLRAGEIHAAFEEMSRHTRSTYPPVWDPPPRMGWGEREPSEPAIREALAANPPAPWVQELYEAKLERWERRRRHFGEAEPFAGESPLKEGQPAGP